MDSNLPNSQFCILRIKFAREDEISYIAHLDMMRLLERAINRAKINCDYTKGFNPRPIMSFALPSGVGVASIDDYFEVNINGKINPSDAVNRLNKVLPKGARILEAKIVEKEKQSLMAQVCASVYLFVLPNIGRFADIISSYETLLVEKESKNKKKIIDIKDFIIEIKEKNKDSFVVKVKAGSSQNLRPDLLLKAIIGIDGFTSTQALDTQVTRLSTLLCKGDNEYISPIN